MWVLGTEPAEPVLPTVRTVLIEDVKSRSCRPIRTVLIEDVKGVGCDAFCLVARVKWILLALSFAACVRGHHRGLSDVQTDTGGQRFPFPSFLFKTVQ